MTSLPSILAFHLVGSKRPVLLVHSFAGSPVPDRLLAIPEALWHGPLLWPNNIKCQSSFQPHSFLASLNSMAIRSLAPAHRSCQRIKFPEVWPVISRSNLSWVQTAPFAGVLMGCPCSSPKSRSLTLVKYFCRQANSSLKERVSVLPGENSINSTIICSKDQRKAHVLYSSQTFLSI